MAIFSRVLIGLAIVLVAAGTLVSGKEESCNGLELLKNSCYDYVQLPLGPAVDPSPECCKAVKTADIPCACSQVTLELERKIDMSKVVHVSAFCGKPFAHGDHCGSFVVP